MKDCKQTIKYSIRKDKRHDALLHKEKQKKPQGGESVDQKSTSPCEVSEGGVSCNKLVLVDVVSKERPESICRVYAIIDDQSNASLITSDLADELGATGPEEKYYLTTCSGEKEAKYGRRVTGVVLKSLNAKESELPTLIECNNVPRDKQEILTPDMARKFSHLSNIANEIPQFDEVPKFTCLSDETLRSCLKGESSERALRSPVDAEDNVRLDNNGTDVPRHLSGDLCTGAPAALVSSRTIRGRSQRRQTITNSCHVLTSLK